jgi:hypothetical protein
MQDIAVVIGFLTTTVGRPQPSPQFRGPAATERPSRQGLPRPQGVGSILYVTDGSMLLSSELLKDEKSFWGNCCNTFSEEIKQFQYAKYMGLKLYKDCEHVLDAQNKKILDIGGGPCSLLLKCQNLLYGKVIDPCDYPVWTPLRYKEAKIDYLRAKGEDITEKDYDEVWMYNVLKHVIDPEKVLLNAIGAVDKDGRILRIFDWIDIWPYRLHPHMLTTEFFSSILELYTGEKGKTEIFYENGIHGRAYYGAFQL